MAAILRVAGGLDRSNTQQVSDVIVEFGKKKQMTLRLTADSFPRSTSGVRASGRSCSKKCSTSNWPSSGNRP